MRTNVRQCTAVKRVKTASFWDEPFTLGEFFFKGGSVGQNFNFFTEMAGEFLFMNSGSCLSPVLCAHVSRLKRCKPFPYQSRPTDAMGL